ncbi:MAG: DUF4160 domain-containing protein [Ignavibacteriales bacterium]|nr:DUF4160 domain-containing protein [Ignavibacteriales bacterium]
MPSICEFFGISIYIYYNDHAPPHFHARYAEFEALLRIDTVEILGGRLPERAMGLVVQWANLHRAELTANWERARDGMRLNNILPLE